MVFFFAAGRKARPGVDECLTRRHPRLAGFCSGHLTRVHPSELTQPSIGESPHCIARVPAGLGLPVVVLVWFPVPSSKAHRTLRPRLPSSSLLVIKHIPSANPWPAYDQAFHDSNLVSRRHARPRQRWLILFSLGVDAVCGLPQRMFGVAVSVPIRFPRKSIRRPGFWCSCLLRHFHSLVSFGEVPALVGCLQHRRAALASAAPSRFSLLDRLIFVLALSPTFWFDPFPCSRAFSFLLHVRRALCSQPQHLTKRWS